MAGNLGDNVRKYRRVAGWSQEQLAEAAGLATSTVAKVERGGDVKIATLHLLARALDVTTSALFAASVPKPVRNEEGTRVHLIELRQAITPPIGLFNSTPTTEITTEILTGTRRRIEEAHASYHGDRYHSIALELPSILRSVQHPLEVSDDLQAEFIPVRISGLYLAGKYLTQVRQYDLAYHVLSEGIREARALDQRLLAATGVVGMCWLLLRQGRFDECERLASVTADAIEPQISKATPEHLAVWGELLQRIASAAVRNNKPDVARDARRLAVTAASAIDAEHTDYRTHWASFGPLTAAMKTVEDLSIIGDHRSVLRRVEDSPLGSIKAIRRLGKPTPNNWNRHRLDVAHAHAALGDHREAMDELIGIRRESPEWVKHQGMARDVMGDILHGRKRTLTSDMREMASYLHVTG
ncbi:helix-turn-helix domain-containing protein [Embleya sp. NBC_00888]|uniref:helix-turn-helix domain-containing protein n=1 Tax=Embleya sp. NBC_00888 TaxID=2975960 RepID=UPI003868B37F|nr:helix-turn-helix domain-containing protein [Embleya sp. NBC_00888]